MLHYPSPPGLLDPLCLHDSRQASCMFVDPQVTFVVSVGVTCQLSYSSTYIQAKFSIAIASGAQKPFAIVQLNPIRYDSIGSVKNLSL